MQIMYITTTTPVLHNCGFSCGGGVSLFLLRSRHLAGADRSTVAMSVAGEEDLPGVPRLVTLLSSLLRRTAESNDALRGSTQSVTVFHSLARPAISIGRYLQRIFTYARCSPCCYIIAYIYLDRLAQNRRLLVLDSLNVHRLLITTVMVAAKFMDDICYNNAYFAKVGGVSTLEMNYMERDLLFGLNFHLNVTPTAYQSYCNHLRREMCLERPVTPLKTKCFLLSSEPEAKNNHRQQGQITL